MSQLPVSRLILPLACALWLPGLAGQEPALRFAIGPREITGALPDVPHVEPHLAVSPTDPEHLVAGVIAAAADRSSGPWHCAALASRDGGRSWRRSDLTAAGRCIDPWALLLRDGTALLATIEIRATGEGDDRLALRVSRSSDGGVSWEAPIDLGGGWEHPLLLEDGGRVLLAARRAVRRDGKLRYEATILSSADGGRTFEPLRSIALSNLTNTVTGWVGSGGDLILSVLDEPRWVDGAAIDPLTTRRAWVLRFSGSGWSVPLFVTEACGGETGFPGWPALTALPTATGQSLVHACVAAGSASIAVSVSGDGGETWRPPVMVEGLAADPEVRTPMLAATPDGVLALAWYDRSADPEACSQQLVVAVSTDGGRAFSRPRPLSDRPACPRTPENGSVAESWPMGGDYGSLAAGLDGRLHAVWADLTDGRFRIRHAALRIAPDDAAVGEATVGAEPAPR